MAGLTGLRIIVILDPPWPAWSRSPKRSVSRYLITRQLTRESFDRDDRPWLTAAEHAQVADALAAEQGDISVYGTYSPFVGSGVSRGGWSFAINLARGKEAPGGQVRLEPLSFEVEEFYQEIERDMAAIGLADLTIENRLLVDGQHIRDDAKFFLPDPEGGRWQRVSAERLAQLTGEPELANCSSSMHTAANVGRRSLFFPSRELHQAGHRAPGRGPAFPVGAIAAGIPAGRPAGLLAVRSRSCARSSGPCRRPSQAR